MWMTNMKTAPIVLCTLALLLHAGNNGAAQTNTIQLRTGGSNSTTLKAAATGGALSLTFPSSAGTSGQALTTDGSGNLSWASAASSIDALTDGKSGGTNFGNSLILGHEATGTLSAGDPAEYNTAVGFDAMRSITTGNGNSAIGFSAGGLWSTESWNTAIGFNSQSEALGARNTTVGYETGWTFTSSAEYNVGIGYRPFRDQTDGSYNIGIGADALYKGGSGNYNIAIGVQTLKGIAGATPNAGSSNIAIGNDIAMALTTGEQNVVLGHNAGYNLTTGSRNVIIGYNAGSNGTTIIDTESDRLFIDNSNTESPLIGGDFSANTLTFTGSVTTTGTSKYSAATGTATTANTSTGAGAQDLAAFTGTYEKVAVTATTSAGYVQLPTGTAGQVVYLQLTFTANGSNTVTVVNSDNNNTAMVYDGTGADIIVAHMIYTSEEGWVIFSAIEYDN
jgi:hypothetical protein